MPRTFAGTETSATQQDHTFKAPYPSEVTIRNDGPDDLLVGVPEVLGGDLDTLKAGEVQNYTNLAGDIQKVTTSVANGQSAAYRGVANVVRDLIGEGGRT